MRRPRTRSRGSRRSPLLRGALICAAALVAFGCADSQDTFNNEPSDEQPIGGTEGVRLTVADDAPPIVVVWYRDAVLDELLADFGQRQLMLREAFDGRDGVEMFVSVIGRGRFLVDGALPWTYGRGLGQECTFDEFAALGRQGEVLVSVAQGLCGMEHTQVAVEFGADGAEIADRRFIDDPQSPAVPGTVAIDRPASRGYAPGEPVEVVLDPVPEDQIEPRSYDPPWPPLRPFVCFDGTVHSGSAGPDGAVVPEVVVADGGTPVPIPEPTNQIAPREVIQDPDSVVVWSFGPIDLAEHHPDEITVTATEGEIDSWDVSARHC